MLSRTVVAAHVPPVVAAGIRLVDAALLIHARVGVAPLLRQAVVERVLARDEIREASAAALAVRGARHDVLRGQVGLLRVLGADADARLSCATEEKA